MPLPAIAAALLPLVAEFGPGLVRWIAGDDAGDTAAQVAEVAKAVTGADTASEALALARADPALAAQLRQRFAELDVELERLYLADRQSARERDVEVRRVAGGSNSRADIMLALAFGSVCVIAALLALGKVDPASAVAGFLISVGGMFARNIGTAFDFEFGSSRGSREKTVALEALTGKGKAEV